MIEKNMEIIRFFIIPVKPFKLIHLRYPVFQLCLYIVNFARNIF